MAYKVNLLDCTLRDGGYINNWKFGEDGVTGILKKLSATGIEMIEIGFLKGETFDPGITLFPDTDTCSEVLSSRDPDITYVAMFDMSAPLPLDKIQPRKEGGLDGIRVIFKKPKMDAAYPYCKHIKEMGYKLFINLVSTDQYSDEEFISCIHKFEGLHPDGYTIVDTFGVIKRKSFLHYVKLMDREMPSDCMLCYHAHNNLQQAFGNSEALLDMDLKRDICIDACVFGMGRGAGNLCLELLAGYMNENYQTMYRIQPMLEIMDEYLTDFYHKKFWGYALPFYLTASLNCHPNYGTYLAEKGTLTEKMFNEILKSISDEDKLVFSKEAAEKYFLQYMESFLDDKEDLSRLTDELAGKRVIILAPGKSLNEYRKRILTEQEKEDTVTIGVSFSSSDWHIDYIFSPNMRRFSKIQGKTKAKCIITSNMKEATQKDYVVNFSSFASKNKEILDNSGLMLLRLLSVLNVKEVLIAGMDGYSPESFERNYFSLDWEFDFSKEAEKRNQLISEDLKEIRESLNFRFLTPTVYKS